jgi:ATP-binding protein involved in chromosome partitioning
MSRSEGPLSEGPFALPVPHAITRRSDGLFIEWDTEGHTWLYAARPLRLACRCASCTDELSGRPLLDPAQVPAAISPDSVALVGGYGIRVRWSDGHDTGIYTFEQLRAACGCERCRRAEASGPLVRHPDR